MKTVCSQRAPVPEVAILMWMAAPGGVSLPNALALAVKTAGTVEPDCSKRKVQPKQGGVFLWGGRADFPSFVVVLQLDGPYVSSLRPPRGQSKDRLLLLNPDGALKHKRWVEACTFL